MTPERAAELEAKSEELRRALAARRLRGYDVVESTGTFWTAEQLAERDACCVADTTFDTTRTAIYLTREQCEAINARCPTHGHDNPEPAGPPFAEQKHEDWQFAGLEWVWR